MIFEIRYEDGNNFCRMIFENDKLKTVKECKLCVSKTINILSEYIVLKCGSTTLHNDMCLDEYTIVNDSSISLQMEVLVVDIYDHTYGEKEYRRVIMEYGDRIRDLRLKYCSLMKLSDVIFKCEKICNDNDYLRSYFCEPMCAFIAFSIITVRVMHKDNSFCDIEAYGNDNIRLIRNELIQRRFCKNKKMILMMENTILYDGCELYKYGNFDPLIINIGYLIYVKDNNGKEYEFYVNFYSKISFVSSCLAKQLNIECSLICLMMETGCLEDNETVGFYHLKEGDTLHVDFKLKLIIQSKEFNTIEHIARQRHKIRDIKAELSKKFSINALHFILLYNDCELKDELSIESLKFDTTKSLSMILLENSVNHNNDINENHLNEEENNNYPLNCRNFIDNTNLAVENDQNISLMILDLSKEKSDSDIFYRIIVTKESSVQYLRTIISEKLRIGMCNKDIFFLGEVFRGGTFDKYKIENNNTLVLKERHNKRNINETFILNVKNQSINTSDWSAGRYMIDDFMTVGGLKNILRVECNVSTSRLKLLINSKELTDDTVIRELDISSEDTATLIIGQAEDLPVNNIKVTVRNYLNNGNVVYNFDVSPNELVRNFEENIRTIDQLSSNSFVVSYSEEILKHDNVLCTYGIKDGDEIVLSESVYVRYFVGNSGNAAKVNRYVYYPCDTVMDLKLRIKKILNIDPRFINLSFNGINMENEGLLAQCDVKNDSYIMMIATLSGGDWCN